MLPFTKRSARSEEVSELIKTGDLQVVQPAPVAAKAGASAFPAPPSARPRVFTRSVADDEMTTLLPRKGMTFSSRPPPAVTPVPMPKLASSRPPRAMLEEPPTRQFVRPSAPPPSVSPLAGPPRASNRPTARLGAQAQAERGAMKPAKVENLKSDPRLDPPATVITARTRIVAARPTMSWAAALVAMGVFVGLVTAVVARGDADTLIDATASFVDPSGAHAAAAGLDVSSVQTKADERRTSLVATVDTLLPAAPLATADTSAASPLPPRPAPVAYAAPVHHAAWHPAPARPAATHEERASHDDRVASNAAPKPAAAPKAAPSRTSRATDDDVESASAADALAKAQLEASLR